MIKHKCPRLNNLKFAEYGAAITRISLGNDGYWSIGNDEYESYPIYFCPCCGVNLQYLVTEEVPDREVK